MACYAALASLGELLDDIESRNRRITYQFLWDSLQDFKKQLEDCSSQIVSSRRHEATCYAAAASIRESLAEIDRINPRLDHAKQQEINSLFNQLQSFMEQLGDCSSKGDEAADRVERLIRDAAYEAQDIIDMEISRKTCRPSRTVIERSFDSRTTTLALSNMKPKISEIGRQLQGIKERQGNQHLQPNYGSSGIHASQQMPSGGNTMVGFDSYLISIKEQLCGLPSQFRVISIVGTGGIGKTTLARNIYDNSRIVQHFDFRAWVTVSQNYDVKIVLHSLLKPMGLTVDESNGDEESMLRQSIYKYLKRRRYLVIIDDMWKEETWDDVKQIFPADDCNGSRIVLTTRLLNLVQYAGSCDFVHQIQFLNEQDSWNLLQAKVFVQDCCPPELENIGKSIARKCYGLPLAIVAIAGILCNVRLRQEWEEIEMNMRPILSGTGKDLSNVLSLSYNHLPNHLKACFLYMGSFPEDYEINVSNLIWLWVAEGFLNYNKGFENLEKVGEECLEDLVKRNLVLITKKRANDQFKLCVLHDLVREFCKHKAFDEGFSIIHKTDEHLSLERIEQARRFYVHYGVQNCPLTPSKVAHSILWFCKSSWLPSSFYDIEWGRYESLRVWGTYDIIDETNSIPDAFSRMFRLKYLCYHGNIFLEHVHPPSSIFMLQNLQTLIIHAKFSRSSVTLPPEIWKMTQLRHVMINKMVLPPLDQMDYICGGIPGGNRLMALSCLQTLMTVLNFTFTKEVIRKIPVLKKLKTHYRESKYNDGTEWQHSLEGLMHLIHLTRLTELEIRYDVVIRHRVEYIRFPGDFSFPLSLEKLSLGGCRAPWKDLTVVGSLPNLQVLKLRYDSFVGDEWEPIEGQFSCLKFLLLESLDLKHWLVENSHFPCLEHLKIRECKELKGIPVELGDIPTLKFIDIFESDFVEESAMQIREDQEENWGNDIQVRLGYR